MTNTEKTLAQMMGTPARSVTLEAVLRSGRGDRAGLRREAARTLGVTFTQVWLLAINANGTATYGTNH